MTKMPRAKKATTKSVHDVMMEKTFTLDGQFIKREAKDAIRSYFMPFSGIYAAATGKKVILVRERDGRLHDKKGEKAA